MESIEIDVQFEKLANGIIKNAINYSFNLKDLPDLNNFTADIRGDKAFKNIFTELDKKMSHCLYWFEVDEKVTCSNLQELLNSSRELLKRNLRRVPVKNKNTDTAVIYVGVRQGGVRKKDGLSNLSGRMCIHFGYYPPGSTGGLQLVHWTNKLDCKINLKVVEFENLPTDYLYTLEKIVAFKLKPMCGKH